MVAVRFWPLPRRKNNYLQFTIHMSRSTTLAVLVGLSTWFSSVGVFAATGAQQLDRFLDGLSTLSARFVQTISTTDKREAAGGEGTLYLRRPGRFRWEYSHPEQLIVADGKRVWLYDKELEQVSHRSQKTALEGTPALLLSNDEPLEASFDVLDIGQRDGYDWVKMLPKLKDSQFTEILLGLSGGELRRMDIVDSFGQVTHFRFFQIQRNPPLDAALFSFKPPSGIDLISE